jgi:hypothetical protein
MFAIVQNGQIMLMVQAGVPFTWDGIDYPANWCNLSTPEDKAAIGMVDVVYGAQPSDTYYWVTADAPVYDGTQVVINYTSTAKDLTTVKTNAIGQVNSTAYTILFPTDWMVVKAFETSTAIPAAWNTWRQSVRNTATVAVNAIEGATDVDGVASVMSSIAWPVSP